MPKLTEFEETFIRATTLLMIPMLRHCALKSLPT